MSLEFAINRALLGEELGKLHSVIDKKTAIPILSCIKIESEPDTNGIRLTATNMESTIYSHLSDKMLAVTEGGVMCVPAKPLIDAVKLMPNGPIKISCDDNHWVKIIASGSISRKMPAYDPNSWPELQKYDDVDWFDIPLSLFKGMIPAIKFSIATDESRLNLRGAKLEADSKGVRLVSTDGHRVSLASGKPLGLMSSPFEVLIPIEAIDEITKLIADQSEGSVSVAVKSNGVLFKIGSRVLCSRLMTTKFPSYKMPFQALGSYNHFTTFKADELSPSIRRAMLCAKNAGEKESSPAGILMSFEGEKLRINAASADLGEANELLDTNFNGPALRLYCNGKYLLEFLDAVGSCLVRMEIKDGKNQIFMVGERDEIDFYYCLMPMRDPGT